MNSIEKKVVILQSNYIPWKGYFDLIAFADEFIFYDDVQFTKNDWRNRNRIKTAQDLKWLSIPVGSDIHRPIREVKISSDQWQKKHWRSLECNYSRAPYFEEIEKWLKPLYLEQRYTFLSDANFCFIKAICEYLNIKTTLNWSWKYNSGEGKSERLAELCLQAGATEYLTGPSARNYLDEKAFEKEKIKVKYFDYNDYPSYSQSWGPFVHEVSILDLLFNCGKDSVSYMKIGKMSS